METKIEERREHKLPDKYSRSCPASEYIAMRILNWYEDGSVERFTAPAATKNPTAVPDAEQDIVIISNSSR